MKANRYIPMGGMVAVLLLSSCVKDTLYDTPHPDHGVVMITLPEMTADDDYVTEIDGKTFEITESPFTFPERVKAGTYDLVIYNRPEGFVFDTHTARVVSLNAYAGNNVSRADGTPIIPLPGYLKTYTQQITVTADDTLRLNTAPAQRVRDLQFELTITQGAPELIQSVTGTLSGIAGSFDMATGQTTGEPVSTVFSFTREGNMLTADIRLLGTMGAVQTLVLDIVFTDSGRTQRTEVDLTSFFKDFNSDMTTAFTIRGSLETPVGMDQITSEIIGWNPVEIDDLKVQ